MNSTKLTRKTLFGAIASALVLTMSFSAAGVQAEDPNPEPPIADGVEVRLCEDAAPFGGCDIVVAQTTTSAGNYPGWGPLPGAFQLDLTGVSFQANRSYFVEYGTVDVEHGAPETGFTYAGIWGEDDPTAYIYTGSYFATWNTLTGSYPGVALNGKDIKFASPSPEWVPDTNFVINLGLGAIPLFGLSEFGGQIWGDQT